MSKSEQAGASARIATTGVAFLVAASIGWGINFPIMKNLLTEWPPLSSRGLAGVAGALALAAFALYRKQSLGVPRAMWLRLLLVSLLTMAAWTAFMGLALVWLSGSEAAVMSTSLPVWAAFLAWPILGERVSIVRALALAVALVGITVMIGGDGFASSFAKWPGIAFALVGTVAVALGTILTKHFPLAMPPLALASWQLWLGCLPVAIVGLIIERPDVATLSSIGWASMAYLTLIQFGLSYVCWFAALERLPAATASIGTLLVPVIGVLASAAMLHEPLGVQQISALVITLGGVAVALRS